MPEHIYSEQHVPRYVPSLVKLLDFIIIKKKIEKVQAGKGDEESENPFFFFF